VREHFGARAAQLGWTPHDADRDATLKLRNDLLPLVADVGGDAALKSQARALALAWLSGDRRELGSTYRAALLTAARDADAAVYDAFIGAVQKATDVGTREDIYSALGHVRDPQLLQRAFRYALVDSADAREAEEVFHSAGEEPANAEALLAFVRQHAAEFGKRLPDHSIERMPRWHQELCTPAARDAVKATYAASRVRGIQRNLAQAVETIDVCIRNRAMQAAAR
jgi:nucleotide-binding universal stress UspA family protein